jgi:hypothetical protein
MQIHTTDGRENSQRSPWNKGKLFGSKPLIGPQGAYRPALDLRIDLVRNHGILSGLATERACPANLAGADIGGGRRCLKRRNKRPSSPGSSRYWPGMP